jgi:hypothetical protein
MQLQKYDIKPELLESFDLVSFINKYRNVSTNDFILKDKTNFSIDKNLLAEQLKLNFKLSNKIPTFYAANCWLSSKSFEQASGEKSALYKASLFSGKKLLDICGGLGVDDWAFSARFDTIVSIDIDSYLNVLVNHNFNKLKLNNTRRITADAYLFLKDTREQYDLIYIDSDRRVNNKKGFRFDDIEPAYSKIEGRLKELTNHVLLKLSPLIDISYCVNHLENLKSIHVVAHDGEVKEVLCEIDYSISSNQNDVKIVAVDIEDHNTRHFSSTFSKQQNGILANDYTFAFFYEASSAIVKAGLCQEYGKSLELLSLSIQTSYFVSNSKLDDFMGRRFDIVKAFAFSKKSLKEYLKTNNIIKANVSRNQFPVSPEEIKKQFQIRDGGDEYLFFTSQSNGEKLVLHCRKI